MRGGGEAGYHLSLSYPAVRRWTSEQVMLAREFRERLLFFYMNILTTSDPHLHGEWEIILQNPILIFPDAFGSIHPNLLCAPLYLVCISIQHLPYASLTILLLYQPKNSLRLCLLSIPSTKHCAWHNLRIMTLSMRTNI